MLKRVLLVFCTLLLLSCSRPSAYDQNGKAFRLSDHKHQWLVVNYWADWCAPCQKEIPELNQFSRAHPIDVQVVGIHYDFPSRKKLMKQGKKFHIDYPLLQQDLAGKLNLPAVSLLPVTFITNADGSKVKMLSGPQTIATLEDAIESLGTPQVY